MEYPVSEVFTSPQGEGVYTGTMMTFVRLAGCTVGKRYPQEHYQANGGLLPIYTDQCTLYDGRTFPCDTDFRKKQMMTVSQICKQIPTGVKNVCITGGEPAMHKLDPLFQALQESGYWIHIETSGTIMLNPTSRVDERLWVTVSPKDKFLDAMIQRANELKLLVDQDFDYEKLPKVIKQHPRKYIQPINSEHCVDPENVKRCVDLQRRYPQLRLSLQLHKVLSEYMKELVR